MMREMAECLTILYGSTRLKLIPDTMQGKYMRLYLLSLTLDPPRRLIYKHRPMSIWQMSKYLKCDIRTAEGVINMASDRGMIRQVTHSAGHQAWQFPDLLLEAERHLAANLLRPLLPQPRVDFLSKRLDLTMAYVQEKIDKWTTFCLSKDPDILFGMLLHNR